MAKFMVHLPPIEVEAVSASTAAYEGFSLGQKLPAAKVTVTVVSSDGKSSMVRLSEVKFAAVALTEREQQVAQLVMEGASNADIAKELAITLRTVKAHISHIFEKLHVGNRVNLATRLITASVREEKAA